MRVLVFGATGLAGRYIVWELLRHNHQVTAFVRTRDRLDLKLVSLPQLTIVEGDVLISDDVERSFDSTVEDGQFDAVVSCINEGLDIKLFVQSKGTRLILDAMNRCSEGKKKKKKPRFVALAGAGMLSVPMKDEEGEDLHETQLWKETSGFSYMLRHVSREHERVLNMIRAERDLEWTLVCPHWIVEERADGRFVVAKGTFPSSKVRVKAGNLAQFLVEELTVRSFINERVGITDA